MRVDKYLWCVRIFKTRSLATKVCNTNAVHVNESSVKPSRNLKVGDVIKVKKNQVQLTLKVLEFPKNRVGAKLVEQYVDNQTPQSEYDKIKLLKAQFTPIRDVGTGRPTKKDRRDMQDWTEEWNALDLESFFEED